MSGHHAATRACNSSEVETLRIEVLGTQGYSRALSLTTEELEVLRGCIRCQYLDVMRKSVTDFDSIAGEHDVDRYHEVSHLFSHNEVWRKRNRCLPQDDIERIKQFSVFHTLRNAFGNFTFSNIVYENNEISDGEEVYWRLVRPGEGRDVGHIHADRWFSDILHLDGRTWPAGSFTVKLWFAVWCVPSVSGLGIVPGSHLRKWAYSAVDVNGNARPRIDEDAKLECIPTSPGNILVFPEDTLHGGIVNNSDATRVSAEITLVFPDRPGYMRDAS